MIKYKSLREHCVSAMNSVIEYFKTTKGITQAQRTQSFLFILFLTVIFILFSSFRPKNPDKNIKPNIVFILADDLGWRDAGFMGSKYYETPAIDKLAASGMVFTDGYANAPNCAPSRAALMTGLYGPRTGIYTVNSAKRGKDVYRRLIPVENKIVLDSSFVTLAEVLKQNGYVSASVGKWHLGNPPHSGPISQGFDINVGGWQLGHPKAYFSPYGNPYLTDGPKGEYLTDRLTREALRFIEENKDRPFFLYFPHYAVHAPFQAKDSLKNQFINKPPDDGQKNPVYAAMIKSLDESVGRIIRKLDELHLRKNTIVVFMSDNGGVTFITSNTPLRGGKGMLYEGGIREPFIVSWPGKIKSGTVSPYPIIGTDMFPTLLHLTGSKPEKRLHFDGINLSKLLLKGKTPRKRALYWHFPAYLEQSRGIPGLWRTTPASAIRYGNWKLIRFYETRKTELYNLAEDIGEQNDLSLQNPKEKAKLEKMMDRWLRKTHAFIPTQKNPAFDPEKYQQRLKQIKVQTYDKK